jgi:hypothetical protein
VAAFKSAHEGNKDTTGVKERNERGYGTNIQNKSLPDEFQPVVSTNTQIK